MESSIQMAEGIFGRCQTCMRNLMKGICGIACDPNQDKYLTIIETQFSFIFNKTYANKVEYRMEEKYPLSVFESCKEVIHPASGKKAFDLACGTEAAKCTPEQWYWFMGDPANPLVPFKIDYIYSDEPERRFTSETKQCEEAYDGSYACSCIDCAKSCPIADPPEAEDPGYLLFELNGTTFIVAIVIGSFGVISLIFATAFGSKITIKDLPRFLGGFEEVNTWLTQFFRWWGRSERNSN
jgi:Niemann-Pick C1 protein